MTDPADALKSFQQILLQGLIRLQRGDIDPELFVYLDHPNRTPRFTYVRLQGRTVTAIVIFVAGDLIEGVPSFNIGYAVPKAYRKQGRAKEAIGAAISEMRNGFGRAKVPAFYVEAIVGVDNKASQVVAAQTISSEPAAVIDQFSALPAFHYLRKVETVATK